MACERWENGCGSCPDLTIYPAIRKDATAYNWKRKRSIYQQSNLYVATPSQWLMDRVQRSMMKPIESRVIPNGVDLKIYRPDERSHIRHELGLSKDAKIILGIANQSCFKDYPMLMDAIRKVGQNSQLSDSQIIFIALGSDKDDVQSAGGVLIKKVKFVSDTALVAKYFQAADIYLHAANAENFPNTIIESFACGTPVIATDVGGIREQVEDGVTGFLTPKGESSAMAERIIQLIKNDTLRTEMGDTASVLAQQKFSLERQVKEYLNWYKEILENRDA
jgi:glycosyltransferase involved in cell wall biosynthesis